MGSSASVPALVQWQWYYQVPSLGLWLLSVLLLVLLRGRRSWWAIPMLPTFALWLLEGFGPLLGCLAIAWIVAWLAGRWLPGRQQVADGLATA